MPYKVVAYTEIKGLYKDDQYIHTSNELIMALRLLDDHVRSSVIHNSLEGFDKTLFRTQSANDISGIINVCYPFHAMCLDKNWSSIQIRDRS
jgi:hypothetical protein